MRDFGIAALVAAWVAVIGPFGNDKAGPIELRLLYHMSLSVVVVATFRPGVRLGVAAGMRLGLGRLISAILAILILSAPLSVFVGFVAVQFFPQLRSILTPLDWYLQVSALVLPIGLAYEIFVGRFMRRPETTALLKASPAPQLGDPAEILAVSTEDHYLRIHTAGGSRLVYLTMAEALAGLQATDGQRVHRSWWVARRAVEKAVRRGRGAELHLSSGLVVPVARARLPALKQSGWPQAR